MSGDSGVGEQRRSPRAFVCASSRSNGSDRRGNSSSVGRAPGDRERRRERGLLVEQLLGAVAHALAARRAATSALVGQQVGQEVLAVGQPRQPRLHAVEHLPVGEPLPLLAPPRLRARRAPAARSRTSSVGSSSRAGKIHASSTSCGRALVGDRERDEPVDLVAPEVDAHRDGRRSTGTRRRSSRAPRPRRAPPPGTRAGSRTRRAGRRARRGRAASPGGRRSARRPRRAGRAAARAPAPARPPPSGRCRRRRAAATSPAGAGPSSRATATPARTAASPRPGTARPSSRPRNWREVVRRGARPRRRSAPRPAIGRRVRDAGPARRRRAPGPASGTATTGAAVDHRAQRRLLGEERGEPGERQGGGGAVVVRPGGHGSRWTKARIRATAHVLPGSRVPGCA